MTDIKKNYIFNTAYQLLIFIVSVITMPYISRVLSADGIGIYSYTTSIAAIFSMFAVLGTTIYGQRTIAQIRDDKAARSKIFWEIEILSIISTGCCVVLWGVFILIYPAYKLFFLILTIDLFSVGLDISWFYSGLEKIPLIVFRNAAIKLGSVILLFLFVKKRSDLWLYILILSGSKFSGSVSMWLPLYKYVERTRFSELQIARHFKKTMAYFIPTIAASIYTYLDKVMIGIFTEGTLENGCYEQAEKIVRMAHTVIVSLNTVMTSRMSYLFAQGRMEEIKDKLNKSLAFIFTMGLPITLGISAISFDFVPWFLGNGFEKVVHLTILFSPLVVILSLHNFLSAQLLIPSGQRVRSTKGVVLGAAVNFILNLLLIPRFQSVGAVVATIAAESSICIVYFYMSRKLLSVKAITQYLPKQLIASVVMALIVYHIGINSTATIATTGIQITVGAIVYVLLLIIMRERFTLTVCRQVIHKFTKNK